MPYSDCNAAFEQMSAREKALFIDTRLKWATNAMLISEISVRLYGPEEEEEPQEE